MHDAIAHSQHLRDDALGQALAVRSGVFSPQPLMVFRANGKTLPV